MIFRLGVEGRLFGWAGEGEGEGEAVQGCRLNEVYRPEDGRQTTEGGWPRKGEYRISTAMCPPKGVLRTVENKEF